MKFDLQLHSNEDLEYFKTLFLRNVGTEQISYYFFADDIQVRIQVSGLEGAQLIKLGFFHLMVEGKSTSLTQFCPLSDTRYISFEAIQRLWSYNPNEPWATIYHMADDVESALVTISELLSIVYKVNNLKAFL